MQQTELVLRNLLRESAVVFQCSFVVAHAEQRIGFAGQSFRVVRVNGYGIFRTRDGVRIVLFHKLGRGQRIPVVLRVGVAVYEFVEQPLRVLVLTQSEQGAGHEFLEVRTVIALGAHHPLVGLVADAVVNIQVGAVLDEVLILVGVYRHAVVAQVAVAFVNLALGYQHLSSEVVVVRVVLLLYVQHQRQFHQPDIKFA